MACSGTRGKPARAAVPETTPHSGLEEQYAQMHVPVCMRVPSVAHGTVEYRLCRERSACVFASARSPRDRHDRRPLGRRAPRVSLRKTWQNPCHHIVVEARTSRGPNQWKRPTQAHRMAPLVVHQTPM